MVMPLQERIEKLKEMRDDIVEEASKALEAHDVRKVSDWLFALDKLDKIIAEG